MIITPTIRQIAKNILDHRSVSLTVMSGQMTEELTPLGYGEALRRGWLLPDVDTGGLTISNLLGKIEEMKRIAEADPQIGEAVTVKDGTETYLGVVQSRSPDGKYKITFGGDKKPAAIRDYDVSELNTDVGVGQGIPPHSPLSQVPSANTPRKSPIGTTTPVSPAMR